MTLDMLNILLGAAISFVATTGISLVSHVLQTRRDKQKHAWEIEDSIRTTNATVRTARITQAEGWIRGLAQLIAEAQARIECATSEDADPGQQCLDDWVKTRLSSNPQGPPDGAVLYTLNDSELLRLSNDLVMTWSSVMDEAVRVIEHEPTPDRPQVRVRLANLHLNAERVQGAFLARLDQLRQEAV